jgi:hypothetical protein
MGAVAGSLPVCRYTTPCCLCTGVCVCVCVPVCLYGAQADTPGAWNAFRCRRTSRPLDCRRTSSSTGSSSSSRLRGTHPSRSTCRWLLPRCRWATTPSSSPCSLSSPTTSRRSSRWGLLNKVRRGRGLAVALPRPAGALRRSGRASRVAARPSPGMTCATRPPTHVAARQPKDGSDACQPRGAAGGGGLRQRQGWVMFGGGAPGAGQAGAPHPPPPGHGDPNVADLLAQVPAAPSCRRPLKPAGCGWSFSVRPAQHRTHVWHVD